MDRRNLLPLSLITMTVTFIVTTLKTSNLTQSSELFSKQNMQQLSARFVKLKIWQLSIYRISRKQYYATSQYMYVCMYALHDIKPVSKHQPGQNLQ